MIGTSPVCSFAEIKITTSKPSRNTAIKISVKTAQPAFFSLTISDLENYSLRLIQSFPDAAHEFSQTWDFFMIDEYQDTSPLQVEILNRIVGEKPCFIVGDPQQSIYLFRGARSEVFDAKESELKSSASRKFPSKSECT